MKLSRSSSNSSAVGIWTLYSINPPYKLFDFETLLVAPVTQICPYWNLKDDLGKYCVILDDGQTSYPLDWAYLFEFRGGEHEELVIKKWGVGQPVVKSVAILF